MPPNSTVISPDSASSQPVPPPTPTQPVMPPADMPPATPPVPEVPPAPAGPVLPTTPPAPTKKKLPKFVWVAAAVLVAALLLAGSYWVGTRKHAKPITEEIQDVVSIPKDATVTAECADMRGKQYIVPKDIPTGPIYDVYQGKVVAVEFIIGLTELTNQSSMFRNLGVPKADYNHLTIMPMDPHAGENEMHFHAVMYLISDAAAQKIKCANSSDMMSGSQ